MRLKSFTAESLREAMEAVRLELGDEAVIVDTEERPGFVRVMAAVDADAADGPPAPATLRRAPMEETRRRPPPPATDPAWPEDWPVGPSQDAPFGDPDAAPWDETSSLMDGVLAAARATGENNDTRATGGHEQARAAGGREASRATGAGGPASPPAPRGSGRKSATDRPDATANPGGAPARPSFALPVGDAPVTPEQVVDVIYDALRDQGVPALIGEEILDLVAGYETNDPHRALAATLREMFRFRPIDGNRPEKSLLLVGPPGAGKSRVAAKLAARSLITGERPSLITVDTDRLGAAAPLRAFADAMGQPLLEADTPEGLGGALVTTHQADLVVIDTPGCNHLSDQEMVGLGRFVIATPLEPVAVIPAGIDPIEAADIGHAFADLGATRLIVSRVDAARRVGSILAAAFDAGLALAEFSATPRIKDGLTIVDPMRLAHLLMPPPRGSEWPHHSRYTAADDPADPPRRGGAAPPSAQRRRSS